MSTIIDKCRYKKGDVILIGGEAWIVKKRSWFSDINGFYTYTVAKI